MSGNDKVNRIIGVIGKPHGIKGYSYVRLITDYPDTICKEDILYLDEACTKKLKIEDIKSVIYKGQSRLIFKFYGNEDCINAENLRNLNLYRDSASQPGLDKDSHWVDELVGCSVFLLRGATVMGNDNKSSKEKNIEVKSFHRTGSKSKNSVVENSENKIRNIDGGDCIGIVEEVNSCAYNDNLIITDPDGKTVIIPMYEEYIEKIDIKAKKIYLKSFPEYI